jgi:hypothetical protein
MNVHRFGRTWMKQLLVAWFLMGAIAECGAVEWGYVFVPTANPQALTEQVFADGLRPTGTPSGRNGIDFWNYLARPQTHPLFIMAYRDWDAVRASTDSTVLNGVLFEVALDNNFLQAESVLTAFRTAINGPILTGVNEDIDRVVVNIQSQWQRQRHPETHIEPVLGITGFDGGRILNTSVNRAWAVNRGALQQAQNNVHYQAPTTGLQPVSFALFEASLAYERLDPMLETVHPPSRREHWLAVLYCWCFKGPPLRAAATAGSCQNPELIEAKQFNREQSRAAVVASAAMLLLN